MTAWRDISSVPKDGTVILGISDRHDDAHAYPMVWSGERYGWQYPKWDGGYSPTHWMPHPDLPGGERPAEVHLEG